MIRYMLTLIGVFGVCCLNAQEKQFKNYFEYTAHYDKLYQEAFKKNPNDSAVLRQKKHYDRITRFWDTRIDENGLSDGYAEAMTKVTMELMKDSSIKRKNSNLNGDWINIDHPAWPEGGTTYFQTYAMGKTRVVSIWADPADGNHVLVGLYGGGIFETTNALTTNPLDVVWTPLTDQIPARMVNTIEVKDGVIYAASGFSFGNINFSDSNMQNNHWGLGVIKSFDGGQTWQIPTFTNGVGFNCSDFKILDNGVIYASSKNAFYKSTDNGDSFEHLHTFPELNYGGSPESGVFRIFVHPVFTNKIWITNIMAGQHHIFYSDDGGVTWQNKYPIFQNLLALNGLTLNNPFMVTVTYFNGEVYFLINDHAADLDGDGDEDDTTPANYFFKSSDGTSVSFLNNFKSCNTPSDPNYCIRNSWMNYLTNVDNDFFLIGMIDMHRLNNTNGNRIYSTDGWDMHADVRDLKLAVHNGNKFLLAGTDGGIYRTLRGSNEHNTWQNITNNINGFLTVSMGYYSDNTTRLYDIGTQDTGWYRNDMDGRPQYYTKDHEGASYTSPTCKNVTYFIRRERKLEASKEISRIYNENEANIEPIDNYYPYDNTAPIFEDPIEPNILHRSNYQDFLTCTLNSIENCNITKDAGVCNIISLPTSDSIKRPQAIDVSKNSNKNILTAIYSHDEWDNYSIYGKNQLFLSRNKGQNWSDVTPVELSDSVSYRITDVDIDDHNPNRMWFTLGNITTGIKVFQSENFGETWTNISYNFPNVPVNRIDYDENRKRLYIGTDIGVYYLNTTTNQWDEMGTTLPKGIVTSMYIDDYFNKLVVSLFGRGVWEIDLDNCKDILIDENTTWNSHQVICGDIIVKPGITLTISRANVTAQNIILMKNAKVVWSGGQLHSNNPTDQSYVVVGTGARFSINTVTLNDYKVNVFETAMISMLGNNNMNESQINIFNEGHIDYIVNSTVTFNNSTINLYDNYKYGLGSILSNHITRLDQILMSGLGSVNVYNEEIYIQDEQLIQGEYNFIANDFIKGGSNVTTQVGNGIFETIGNVKVDLKAKNYIMLEKGTYLHNKDFIAHIDNTLLDDLIVNHKNSDLQNTKQDLLNIDETSHIKDEGLIEYIRIFPNPTTGIINYEVLDESLINAKIYVKDAMGKTVKIQMLDDSAGEIDLTGRLSGIYYLSIESSSRILSYKIIKK